MPADNLPANAPAVLEKCWNSSVPVNPISIAEVLGVDVYKNANLRDIDGAFFLKNGIPTIVYRPTGDRRRDKFTIAHEIGHYCLNHGPRHRDSQASFHAGNPARIEREANHFAAGLLMPRSVVDYAVKVSDMATVAEMSEYFDVPPAAMRFWLRRLGYL